MIRALTVSLVLLAGCLGLRLFSGVYVDDEWGDRFWFVKHRPDWQVYFAPVLPNGHEQSDEVGLARADAEMHRTYREFVANRRAELFIPWPFD